MPTTFYGIEVTNEEQTVPIVKTAGGGNAIPRKKFFTYVTPAAAAPAVGDNIQLARLPLGSRILGIHTVNEAMSTAGGTAGADIGYAGDTARYGSAVDMDAAGADDCANTIALNFGDVLAAEKMIIATITGETWAATKKLYGWIEYMPAAA